MAGFGDRLLAYLGTVTGSSVEALAKAAGVTEKQAYSRLMFMTYEGRLECVGRGKNRVWSLASGAPKEQQHTREVRVNAAKARPSAEDDPKLSSLTDRRSYGWKPDLTPYEAFSAEGELTKGDMLLVEYPERWRHSMLCYVTRERGYFGVDGQAQVWNVRDACYSIVDYRTFEERGWKIAKITSRKDFETLRHT